MEAMPVNFGTSFLAFVQENVGPDKQLLILQDKFIKSEYGVTLNDAMLEIASHKIQFQKIKGGDRVYLAIADTRKKIDQYLNSTKEGEFTATVLELPY